MTLMPLLNQNYGVVLSTPSPFMAPLSILHLTPRISRLPLISWLSIFKIKVSMVSMLTTSSILMAWVMPFGISFRRFMRPNGTVYSLTKRLTISEAKFLWNLPWELLRPVETKRRKSLNLFQSPSTKLCPFPLYQLNLRRRSTSYPNTSNPRSPQLKTKPKPPMINLVNPMHRPLNLQSTLLKFWKSKRRSPPWMLKKSIRWTILSIVKVSQNLESRWQQKDHRENKSSFPWVATTYLHSWRILPWMWPTSIDSCATLKRMF